jgi:hypothetical protein
VIPVQEDVVTPGLWVLLLVVRCRKESLSFHFLKYLLDSSANVNAFFLRYLLSAAPESEIYEAQAPSHTKVSGSSFGKKNYIYPKRR